MDILVCARRVPDTSENEIELNRAGNDIERDDMVYSVNEPDNYAVEEALQIVERAGGEVTVVTVGTSEDEEILRRIEPVGAIDRIHTAQNRILTSLLNGARFARLVEQETLDGNLAYSPVEFLQTVRKGVWRELDGAAVKIDPFRRELQRSYLQDVNSKLNAPERTTAAAPVQQLPEGFVLPRTITSVYDTDQR